MSALPAAMLTFSAVMKLSGSAQVVDGFKAMGFPDGSHVTIGVIELLVVLAYVVPPTAVLGAILVTGYLGGAVLVHVRNADGQWIAPLLFGVLAWGGLFLRDARVRALIPLRRAEEAPPD